MKKTLCFLSAMAIHIALCAQGLPKAVYTLDFEGVKNLSEINAIQYGEGELRTTEDVRFGTYYQNCPSAPGTNHQNFLVVVQDGFKYAGEQTKGGFTISFWVNATVQNTIAPQNSYMYSTMLTAYDESQVTGNQWPLLDVRARKWIQVNTAGFWDDFPDGENVNGYNTQDVAWLAQNLDDDSFDNNWHYVTVVFEDYATVAKYYVDGELTNTWNTKSDFGGENGFFTHLYKFTHLVLGGDCPWKLADMDAAFAYDDIKLYAKALTEEEISLVKNYKLNKLSPEESLIIAKDNFYSACADLSSYSSSISEDGFLALGSSLTDFILEAEPSEQTVEAYNEATSLVNNKSADAKKIISSYLSVESRVKSLKDYAAKTEYPGASDFLSVLDEALPARADVLTSDEITAASGSIEEARIKYLFSQDLPADKSGIDVTKIIKNPWFCSEEAEPTLTPEGLAVYPVDNPGDYLKRDGWTNTCTLTSDYDCTVYYTQGRTTWNNFHSSTVPDAVLDIHQQLTNLKPGFYTVSGDMLSSQPPTTNHVYVRTSDGTERVSQLFSGYGWDAIEAGVGRWETLTTDKIYVGEDGMLLIGANSTSDGNIYSGWYCVTNFVLRYYGETSDMDKDVEEKYAEAKTAIGRLMLLGDIANATKIADGIYNSEAVAYEKVSMLSEAIKTFQGWYDIENNFSSINDISALAEELENADLTEIALTIKSEMIDVWSADTTTFMSLPELESIYHSFLYFCENHGYAVGTCPDVASVMVAELKKGNITSEKLDGYNAELQDALKKDFIAKSAAATQEQPVDATCLIRNPKFSHNTSDGWSGKKPTINQYGAEFFNTTFETTQTLMDMPAGKYLLKVRGFYRDGDNMTAESNYLTGSYHANTNLIANTAAAGIQSWASDPAIDEPMTDEEDFTSDYEYYYPNTMRSAAEYLKAGHYKDSELMFTLENDGEIRLGISKKNGIENDWTFFTDFELLYCGKQEVSGDTATYYVTCGDESIYKETAFWTQFSDYYTVKKNSTAHFKFMNYSDKINNWDNWLLVSANSERGSEGYAEHFVIRVDGYGWGASHNEAGFKLEYDWGSFASDMDGSFVDMYVTYKDNGIKMNSVITTKAKEETEHKKYNYSYESKSDIYLDQVTLFFTTEKGYMVGEDNPTGIESVGSGSVLPRTSSSAAYSVTGQAVSESYRGIVIKNGKKILIK